MEEERLAETMCTPTTFCGLVPSVYFIGGYERMVDIGHDRIRHHVTPRTKAFFL